MTKIAISLPEELLKTVERERKARRETRSQFFREAVDALLREKRKREAVERYLKGYREQPETAEEARAIDRASRAVLAEEPWG